MIKGRCTSTIPQWFGKGKIRPSRKGPFQHQYPLVNTNKQIFRSLTIFQKTSRSSRKSVVNESNHFNFPGSLPHWDSPDIHSGAVSWRSHWSGLWFKHLTRLRDNSNQTDWCLDWKLPKLKKKDYVFDVPINANQISWKQARKPQAMFRLLDSSSQV